jgi:hypothetical protein
MSAPALFFLGGGRMTRDGGGATFGDPSASLPGAANRCGTGGAWVLGERSPEERNGPAVCHRAEGGGTVGEELLDLWSDPLPKGGRTPRVGGGGQAGAASGAIRLEPGAKGGRIAVETPGTLGDPPPLGIAYDIGTAFGDLGPRTARLFHMRFFFR